VLGRLAGELPRGLPRAAFLLNQQACMLGALAAVGVPPCATLSAATEAHAGALAAFVDEVMEAHLRGYSGWVKRVVGDTARELAALPGGYPGGKEALSNPKQLLSGLPEGFKPPMNLAEAEAAVRDLDASWKGALAAISGEVDRYFGAGKLPREVIRACFSEVAEFQQRGVALLGRVFPPSAGTPPAWARDMTSLQSMYFEMRRYGRSEA